jgi:uncharacterized delta-60 repeat protein
MRYTIFFYFFMMAAAIGVQAAPGDLDRSFGSDGFSHNAFPNISSSHTTFLSDGKFVFLAGLGGGATQEDFFIARFNADGSPDTTFDGDGQVTVVISSRADEATTAVLQPDGKLLVGGTTREDNANYNIVLIRLNANGSLDTSFDGDGIVKTDLPSSDERVNDMLLRADGKIVVGGSSFAGMQRMFVARYNSNGSPDTGFDGDGIAITAFSEGVTTGDAIAQQTDGKIVIVGALGVGGTFDNATFAVARYNTDGTLDTKFGTAGTGLVSADVRTPPAGQQNAASDVQVQPDGKILAIGNTNGGSVNGIDFAMLRLNMNGTPDNGFGSGGKVITSSAGNRDDIPAGASLLPQGKILVWGPSTKNNTLSMIVRYHADGTPDTTYPNGTTLVVDPVGSMFISQINPQADGRYLAFFRGFGQANFVRLQGNGLREVDFDGDRRSDISVFRPSEGNWYLLQSQAGFSGFHFGLKGDRTVPADYDSDGKTDVAIYRGGIWYLLNSAAGLSIANFGTAEDLPQPADFDGDGKSELAVFRPSEGNWYVYNLATNQFNVFHFGSPGDKPVVGDYDGDGKADYAVFRPADGNWYIQRSTDGLAIASFGISTDKPVPADYDGDGKTDLAVYRDGVWYLFGSFKGVMIASFGTASDLAAPADFDGDGRADITVFRPSTGTWYLNNSQAGITITPFGLSGDKPVPASIYQ